MDGLFLLKSIVTGSLILLAGWGAFCFAEKYDDFVQKVLAPAVWGMFIGLGVTILGAIVLKLIEHIQGAM